MKRIMTTAILLAALGGGAAMAQGLPTGYGAWQSGWHGGAQAQAMRARPAARTRFESRAAAPQSSGPISLAGDAHAAYR